MRIFYYFVVIRSPFELLSILGFPIALSPVCLKFTKNKKKLRTILPKNHENLKNNKPRVQFYWFLLKKECSEKNMELTVWVSWCQNKLTYGIALFVQMDTLLHLWNFILEKSSTFIFYYVFTSVFSLII